MAKKYLDLEGLSTLISNVLTRVNKKSDTGHTHDERYYTETEIDSKVETVNSNLNNKMDKENPAGTGSLSLNRKTSSALGSYSVALGENTQATGEASVAVGKNTAAAGVGACAEGVSSIASYDGAHAEGTSTEASSWSSHAEGEGTVAGAGASHAEGYYTNAGSLYQHVEGKYNIADTTNQYAHILGNGSSTSRSNAHTVDWSGNGWFAGNLKIGGSSYDTGSAVALASSLDGKSDVGHTHSSLVNGTRLLSWTENSTNVLSLLPSNSSSTTTTYNIGTSGSLWTAIYAKDVMLNNSSLIDLLAGKSDTSHNHNSSYYLKTETDSKISSAVSTHNTNTAAHNDIRNLITALSTKVSNFLDVDDTTTDQLSEVLALINDNKGTLESLTTSKVNVADIVNNLTTNSSSKVLSAAQGVAIKALIDALEDELDTKAAASHTHSNYASTISTSGTGNAITALSQSGNTITATKGSTFSLSSHTHSNYASTITSSGTGNAITALSQSGNTITATKGSTFSLDGHTHSGYASTISTTGTGNAVTALSQSGNTITATKGSTFSLSSHTHSNYASTVTTSGSGNAITAISQSGNTITATKGSTFAASNIIVVSSTQPTSSSCLLWVKTTS